MVYRIGQTFGRGVLFISLDGGLALAFLPPRPQDLCAKGCMVGSIAFPTRRSAVAKWARVPIDCHTSPLEDLLFKV